MKLLSCGACLSLLALASLFGCGKDPDRPSTLAEQQSLMNGSHKPTKDQLAAAMSRVHFAGPKGGPPATGAAGPTGADQTPPPPKS